MPNQDQGKAMARRPIPSDETLIELFLDMQAAERGDGENTLAAHRNALADLSAHLRAAGRGTAIATTDALRGLLARLAQRGLNACAPARPRSSGRSVIQVLDRWGTS